MAKIDLKSVYTAENQYTVLQLLRELVTDTQAIIDAGYLKDVSLSYDDTANKLVLTAIDVNGKTTTYDTEMLKLTVDEKSWIDDTKEYIKYNITDNYGSIEHQLIITNPSSDAPTIDTQSGYIKAQYFQGDQLVNSNGNALARYKSAENKSVFGSSENGALIMGNDDRLHYSNKGSNFTGMELAYVSDLPSMSVFQHYIKITFANSTGYAYITIDSPDTKYSSIQTLCAYIDGRDIQQIPATGYFIDGSDYFMIIGGSPYMYGPGMYHIMFDMYSPVSNTHKTYDGMTITSVSDNINKIALIDIV